MCITRPNLIYKVNTILHIHLKKKKKNFNYDKELHQVGVMLD